MRIATYVIALSLVAASALAAHSDIVEQVNPIEEARDHVFFLPEKSLSLLETMSLPDALTQSAQFEWHFTYLAAAAQLSDLDKMESALTVLQTMIGEEQFEKQRTAYYRYLGVLMRRGGNLDLAKKSYLCSLNTANSAKEALIATRNLAVVERNLGNLQRARSLNEQALKVASLDSNLRLIASIENNLGVIALQSGELPQAAEHFRRAMNINQQAVYRAGELLNGINLLFSFTQLNDELMYSRLYPRIERMLTTHPDEARSAYLFWVNSLFTVQQTGFLAPPVRAKLEAEFIRIRDTGIQHLLLPFADLLGANVAVQTTKPRQTVIKWQDVVQSCSSNTVNQNL